MGLSVTAIVPLRRFRTNLQGYGAGWRNRCARLSKELQAYEVMCAQWPPHVLREVEAQVVKLVVLQMTVQATPLSKRRMRRQIYKLQKGKVLWVGMEVARAPWCGVP